jgi:hypothetical protein
MEPAPSTRAARWGTGGKGKASPDMISSYRHTIVMEQRRLLQQAIAHFFQESTYAASLNLEIRERATAARHKEAGH